MEATTTTKSTKSFGSYSTTQALPPLTECERAYRDQILARGGEVPAFLAGRD